MQESRKLREIAGELRSPLPWGVRVNGGHNGEAAGPEAGGQAQAGNTGELAALERHKQGAGDQWQSHQEGLGGCDV